MSLAGKTLFITGGSRGNRLAIALRAARDGANIVIAAKTTEANPNLSGTIYTAAAQVEQAGGTVQTVRGRPQIALSNPAQIELLNWEPFGFIFVTLYNFPLAS